MRQEIAAIDRCRQLLTWARQALVRGRLDEAALHLSALRRELPRISSSAKSCVSAAGRAFIPSSTTKRRAARVVPGRSSEPDRSGPRREDSTSRG